MQISSNPKQGDRYTPDTVLDAGSYIVSGIIPIVRDPNPRDPLKEIERIVHYYGPLKIMGSVVVGGIRWYSVLADSAAGYVSEMVFYGKQIKQIP